MRFLCFFVLLVSFSRVNSQSIVNYASVRSTGVTYASINLTGSSFASWRNAGANSQDDNRSDFTNIGFDFWYNGVRYTQFCVSTNGFLDFSASIDDGGPQADDFGYQNTAFTNANAANATRPAVAPFYDDLTAQGGVAALGSSLKYFLSGAAPSRTLTIEWINMAVFGNVSPSLNFQVKLVESTGQVLVHYGTMTAGSNTFSYSMGLNGPTVSNPPTVAQLKMLQAVNGAVLNNTVQNGLVTMPTANSQYLFTPPAPTAAPNNLTFAGVNQTAMSLNWVDAAINEAGYVVYNSTDGVNYDFVAQTASNVATYASTGLLPATTYFWRVYAVTEGCLSSALNGSQATSAAGNKISNASGTWSTASIWTPAGVPTAADNVTITAAHSVSITLNSSCNNLIVGQGGACTLQLMGAASRSLTVNNNITVNSGARFAANSGSNFTHTLVLEGNIVNNGVISFSADANSFINVIFDNNGNQTVSGTGVTNLFNRVNLSLGASATNTLEISSTNFAAPSGFLDLVAGTFKLSTLAVVNLTPFAAAVNLPASTGIFLNSANATMNILGTVTLFGDISIANGTLNIGDAANEDLNANGGSVNIYGGMMNIAGKLDGSGVNNICDFNISGGMLVAPTFGSTNTTIAPFHISSAGSQCNMTGGTIVIQREGGGGTQNLGFTNVGTSGAIVTGGTLQIGNASTPAAQVMNINCDSQIQNLLVNSANATASVSTISLVVADHVNIVTGILSPGALGVSVGGNWTDAGTFTPGTSTINFNGTTAQSITKTGGETFNALLFSGTGIKTFGSAIIATTNFSISSGATVDVSASDFSLAVRGNFINSGTFTSRTGSVVLNGTSAQTIGGTSTTDFYNLTLSNTTGATLTHAENLKGSLTLSNGTFNASGQVFTLLSDATGTGRIAQITGGTYAGNITAQRFAPGGTTGWAFLGSPISSALTLNDWDDDVYISCPTCPDGSAAGFLSVYTYNEAASGLVSSAASYVPLNTINDPITSGRGYWVYLGTGLNTTTDITLDLTGTPRTGNYSIPINYTNFGSAADDGWNLITNPYPSPISWAALRGVTANLDNAIYVYNADLNGGTGGFGSYVNGFSSPAVASGGQGDVIPMGQGFYVHSTGALAIGAQESNKVTTTTNFLKPSSSATAQPLTRIKLLGANAYEDETMLYFQQGAHDYFDVAYDSYKLEGQDPNAATIAMQYITDLFQINGIAPVVGTYTTPLRTLTGVAGTFTITADDINSFPAGACITLYDKFTSTTTDLKIASYIFNLSDTTTVARFVLSIIMNPLNLTANVDQPSCDLPGAGQIAVIGNSGGPWNYYWSSNGSVVKTSLNQMTADTLKNLSGGVFDLSVNTVGMCDSKEVSYVILSKIAATAAFTSIDTVYLEASPSVQFNNTSVNSASYAWDFGTGMDYSNANSPSFSYSSFGSYTVTLIAYNNTGCIDTAFKTITVNSVYTGIGDNTVLEKQFSVKTLENNLFLIEGEIENAIQSVRLNDITGRLIADYGSQSAGSLNLQIDLKDQAKGVYFLNIISDTQKKVVKLPVR